MEKPSASPEGEDWVVPSEMRLIDFGLFNSYTALKNGFQQTLNTYDADSAIVEPITIVQGQVRAWGRFTVTVRNRIPYVHAEGDQPNEHSPRLYPDLDFMSFWNAQYPHMNIGTYEFRIVKVRTRKKGSIQQSVANRTHELAPQEVVSSGATTAPNALQNPSSETSEEDVKRFDVWEDVTQNILQLFRSMRTKEAIEQSMPCRATLRIRDHEGGEATFELEHPTSRALVVQVYSSANMRIGSLFGRHIFDKLHNQNARNAPYTYEVRR